MTFVVRSSRAGTQAFLRQVDQAVSSVNGELPVAAPLTMQEIYSKSLARTSFTLLMLGIAAAMALALGIIGVYGVISYAVSQRTREIGIRIALGARPASILQMVLGQGMLLAVLGVGIGIAGAVALTGLVKSLLFEVPPTDIWTFSGVGLTLLAAAALASYLPARRAAAVDPNVALRAD